MIVSIIALLIAAVGLHRAGERANKIAAAKRDAVRYAHLRNMRK